jgi:predicted nucleotidyltransferase
MNIPEDFKEFIVLLNDKQVRYLIIGGYAVGFHSRPKFTNDIDVWIENSLENAQRLLAVLQEFGFASLEISADDLMNPDKVIQLGYAPVRIDIITGLSGIDFSKAYANKVIGKYLGITTNFISREDLVASKKLAGRKKDFDDIDWISTYAD